MPRLFNLFSAVLMSAALTTATAATIHINYRDFADTELGRALIQPIVTGDSDVDRRISAELKEVLVYWEKRKAPPVIRYLGVPARDIIDAHGQSTIIRKTPLGMATTLTKNLSNSSIVAYDADQIVVARTVVIPELELTTWPALNPELSVAGTAFPTDIKLTRQLRKHIEQLDLHWKRAENQILLYAQTPSHENAREARSYIMRRRPWIHFGAALGVDALEFPSLLLDDAKITVHDEDQVRLLVTIDNKLRILTTTELAGLIIKQLDKYLGLPPKEE